jgi:hypothetical protein
VGRLFGAGKSKAPSAVAAGPASVKGSAPKRRRKAPPVFPTSFTPREIDAAVRGAGHDILDRFVSPAHVTFFEKLLEDHPEIRTVAEVGFNAGHSAVTFLLARPYTVVVSFDSLIHPYSMTVRWVGGYE